MIPLRDSLRPAKTPLITYLLIGINLVVFVIELVVPDTETFIRTWALVPAAVNLADLTSLKSFLTSIFLHAGWVHLGSNMVFLHVFGDNVEDRLGHFRYLLFYLFWGVVASLAQFVLVSRSTVPILGASGAVAGVMGAYFVFFRRATIETLVPTYLGLMTTVEIPATFMLFYWFVTQLFSGSASIAVGIGSLGGVAWFAHIGGFAAGCITAKTLYQPSSEEPVGVDW